MTVARRLSDFLESRDAEYEIVPHPRTESSMETAEVAHVPGDLLAKAVILKDSGGLLMVVLPSDYHVDIPQLNRHLQRELAFATEPEITEIFPDCEPGAIPPIGPAYGVPTLWDPVLGDKDVVWFEAGDHQTLLRVRGRQFHELMAEAERARFSEHI